MQLLWWNSRISIKYLIIKLSKYTLIKCVEWKIKWIPSAKVFIKGPVIEKEDYILCMKTIVLGFKTDAHIYSANKYDMKNLSKTMIV